MIWRDIPVAVSKWSPIDNLWIMRYSRRLVLRGRPAFFVELNELVSLCSLKILDMTLSERQWRKRLSTILHLDDLAPGGISYFGVGRHLAKVDRTMEQSSHVTLLTIVPRYNL